MADRPFSRRFRLFTVAATLALGVCVLGASGGSAGVTRMQLDSITVNYIGTASLQVRSPSGANVSGGSTSAGNFQVLVQDDDYSTPKFTITGPGVNVSDDLNSTGMGVDHPAYLGPYNFQAGGTYTFRDANLGISTTVSFTTASSSSSGGSTSSGGSSSSGGTTSSGSSSSGSSSSGSKSSGTTFVGTIKASVSVAGKPALSFAGRAVKSLKPGKYKLTIADHSTKANLIIQKTGFNAMTYSTAAAVGTTTHNLTLSSGKWFFRASKSGPKTYFTVK